MRLRLFFSFVIITVITLVGVAYFAIQGSGRLVQEFVGRGGLLGAEKFVVDLELYYQQNQSWQGVEQLFASRGQGTGRGRAGGNLGLVDNQGNFLYPVNSNYTSEERAALLENGIKLQEDGRAVGYLVHLGDTALSGQQLVESMIQLIRRASLNAALIAGVISLVLALAGSYLLQKPVADLIQVVESIASGDLTRRAIVKSPQEMKRLADSFNAMADSLQRAEQNRRDMTADIAHELRNPLAVQRANLEAIQDGIYPLSQASLEPLIEQNRLLNRMVEDLRTLALADAGELSLITRPTHLKALLERTVDRFKIEAGEKMVNLNLLLPDTSLIMELDPERIEQILHNLIQNAIRFTPPGGVVQITLQTGQSWVTITVHDSGPGIPPESMPFVFERFYRADPARDRTEGTTGLGLSIARKLAEVHHGSLTAQNHPDGGALFTLKLPVA